MISSVYGARLAVIGVCAAGALSVGASREVAQLRYVQPSQLTATDGTVFDVTNAVVRVFRAAHRRRGQWPNHRACGGANPAGRKLGLIVRNVILAGGPGDSGVNQVLGLARHGGAVFADLMNGDVVGIDQRGTGRSVPNQSSPALYNLPLYESKFGSRSSSAYRRRSRPDCGPKASRWRAYNTRESADDVAAVYRALNSTRATLWGRSYGTHPTLSTLARHKTWSSDLCSSAPGGWAIAAFMSSVNCFSNERAVAQVAQR